jgi:hypothetical protein
MVGQRPLKPLIGVRIPVGQPDKIISAFGRFLIYRLPEVKCLNTLRQGFESRNHTFLAKNLVRQGRAAKSATADLERLTKSLSVS